MSGASDRPTIGFAGMTHLGLNSGVAAAQRGFDVVCFDEEASLVDRLQTGDLPVVEPQLPETLADNHEHIAFTADVSRLSACEIVYIAPDVPTDDEGNTDLSRVRWLIDLVGPLIAERSLLVVLCQVPPGFTRQIAFDKDRLYYQVETLIFGRAIERALNPERYIIGAAAPEHPLAPALLAYLSAYDCPILPMRYESAELAKISINMCLVASVTTANMLAEICENIGADWSEITPALKLDRRIGEHAYLGAGLGISGGNLERDMAAVLRLGSGHGCDVGMVRNWQHNSKYRRDWMLRQLYADLGERMAGSVIAVLGLAYKPDTDSIKNSPSISLILALKGFDVRAYDPVAAYRPEATDGYKQCDDVLTACDGADVAILATPWQEFFDLDPAALVSALRGTLVIDPYRVLDHAACSAAGLRHVRLGVSA